MDLNSESANQKFCHITIQHQTAVSLLGKEEPNSQAALCCSAAGHRASLMGMRSSCENNKNLTLELSTAFLSALCRGYGCFPMARPHLTLPLPLFWFDGQETGSG